ncbi:mannose-1-phosphate guanylyltransferase/mannose-6-phosphate isomerase [Methanocalculus sp. MSAO_Arc2]|uniref:mannose-1-phosphate guanylyltransferase/mannose-6-phosphate isomerase n=1 Tax=Methanocalculus sp. MSAO_Arc2 TaxID=2293855 RepID=UPI0026B8BB3C
MFHIRTILLAGGSGSRLWPLSRKRCPKQFISLFGETLFQQAYRRARTHSRPDEIVVVTGSEYEFLVKNQIEELGETVVQERILLEPCGRNTLPAIAWGMRQFEYNPDEPVVIYPTDHLVGEGMTEIVAQASSLASDHLVTFGVVPDRPHTGYGYIAPGDPIESGFVVSAFYEKPDLQAAERYISEGAFWNSGIFLMTPGVFFEECQKYAPAIADAHLPEAFPDMPSVSIDYGLLEHSTRVAVVPLTTRWSDLGTFSALHDTSSPDEHGNVGGALLIDSTGCTFIHPEGKRVAAVGVSDIVVVDTDDALLISSRDATERVREVVSALTSACDPTVLEHRLVHRPWGTYLVLEESQFFKIKRITVKPGASLSLQHHHHRSEHWVVVSGCAHVEIDGETRILPQGESTFVRAGALHRLENQGMIPLEMIEVQIGEYLGEDDIVRFDDRYGR